MKIFKSLLVAVAITAAAITGVHAGTASAATAVKCSVDNVSTVFTKTDVGTKFAFAGNKVSGTYKVTGDSTCKQTVTLATWQSPSADGTPYSAQKLFSHVTETNGP